MRLTKKELQGYLFNAYYSLAHQMKEADFNLSDELLRKMGKALMIATKSDKSVTLAEVHAGFELLEECRAAFRRSMESRKDEQNGIADFSAQVEATEAATAETEESAEVRSTTEEAALAAEAEKYSNMAVSGCCCTLCNSYRQRAEEARAALADMPGLTADTSTEETTTETRGNGFRINAAAVIDTHEVTEEEDIKQISVQLDDAPFFYSLSARDMYKKRAPIMYNLTGGAEVLEAKAVISADYLTRFKRQIAIELDELYYKMTYTEWERMARFWRNGSIIRQGVLENRIAPEAMEEFSIRSPKFSKHLIKTFGEKSEIVKLFNDRPRAADIEKQTTEVIEGKKVIVSNLASNVMKMTAENAFSSCQDYTNDDAGNLEHLQKLPSSVHDETMAIAYIVEEDESFEYPHMLARVLISPLEYKGQLFFIGFNVYGDNGDDDILKASLKNLYGDRILFADELYCTDAMHESEYEYDYDLIVYFDYDNDCYLCDGDGRVTAFVRYHDYEFTCDCPHCEGSGLNPDGGEYGAYPYVNNRTIVRYRYNKKITCADKRVLDAILTAEAYGGKDLFSFMAEA